MSALVGKAVRAVYEARRTLARWMTLEAPGAHPLAEELASRGVLRLESFLPLPIVEEAAGLAQSCFDFSRPEDLIYSPDGKLLCEGSQASPEELRRFYFLHIKNFQRFYDVYREIVPRIDPILRSYYQSRYAVRNAYCYRTQPVTRAAGSYEWHRDNYPPGSLKVMVYLTDVTAKSGPLAVAAGSNLGFRPELGRIGDRYDAAQAKGFPIVECLGGRGTVIIFDNNSIHRATDPSSGHRDAINFTVFPSLFPAEPRQVTGLDLDEEKSFLKTYTR